MSEPTTEAGRALVAGSRKGRFNWVAVFNYACDIEAQAAKAERIRLRHEHRLWHEEMDWPLGETWCDACFSYAPCHTCLLLDEPKEVSE